MGVISNLQALFTLKDNTAYGTRTIVSNLNRIASALDVTRLAATQTFKLDNDLRRLGNQMGLAAGSVSKMSEQILVLTNETGIAVSKVTELATAYMATGRTLGELNDAHGDSIEMMVELTGRFGLSAAEAVQLENTIHHLGGTLEGLTDRVTTLQASFRMPGMLNQMSKAVRFAEQMLTRFGKTTVPNTRLIIDSVLRVGAAYAKAYGVDIGRGLDMATQQQQSFLDHIQKSRDVFLGLSDDFGALANAFFETGRPLSEVNRLLKLGAESPAKYAREVLRIRDNFKAAGQTVMAERFFQNIIRNSDEATRSLLTNEKALKAFEEAERAKIISKSFHELVDSMREIGSEVINTVDNLLLLGKTIIGVTFFDEFKESFGGVVGLLKNFNKEVLKMAKGIKESAVFKELKPTLVGIGKLLIAVGGAAAMLATTMASAVIPFQLFVGIADSLPVIGKAVTPIQNIVKSFIDFAKKGFNFAGVSAAVAESLNDFGAALKNPNLTKGEVFIRGIESISYGVVEAFDNILGGMPSRIAEMFFPSMKGRTLGSAVKRFFIEMEMETKYGSKSLIHKAWTTIKNEVTKQYDKFISELKGQLGKGTELNKSAEEWGGNIGRALGKMAKWAWDSISEFFSVKSWEERIQGIVDFLSGKGKVKVGGGFGVILDSLLVHGRTFTESFFNEVLGPFGYGWEDVRLKLLKFFTEFKILFNYMKTEAWVEMKRSWVDFKIWFVSTLYHAKETAINVFDSISNHIKSKGGAVAEFFLNIKKTWDELKVKEAQAELLAHKASALRNPLLALNPTYWREMKEKTEAVNEAKQTLAVTESRLASAKGWQAEGEHGLRFEQVTRQVNEAVTRSEIARLVGADMNVRAALEQQAITAGRENKAFAAEARASLRAERFSAAGMERPPSLTDASADQLLDAVEMYQSGQRAKAYQQAERARGKEFGRADEAEEILIPKTEALLAKLEAVRDRAAKSDPGAAAGYSALINKLQDAQSAIVRAEGPANTVKAWNDFVNTVKPMTDALHGADIVVGKDIIPLQYTPIDPKLEVSRDMRRENEAWAPEPRPSVPSVVVVRFEGSETLAQIGITAKANEEAAAANGR